MPVPLTIGFLGAGKMAAALAQGLIRAGLVKPSEVAASDVSETARTAFSRAVGCRVVESNPEVLQSSSVVFLAVKPGQVRELLATARADIGPQHLLISIAAGITLRTLEAGANEGVRFIRVMPNTPALVGSSASAFSRGKAATAEDAALAHRLLSAVGIAAEVPEPLLDAVTGLSGSGPAYVYLVIDALSDGGVAVGLPREIATKLAAQTVLGAARMVLETGQHPGALRDMVTSPGGTTIEGLHELERAATRSAFINAVKAATSKAIQLGQQ